MTRWCKSIKHTKLDIMTQLKPTVRSKGRIKYLLFLSRISILETFLGVMTKDIVCSFIDDSVRNLVLFFFFYHNIFESIKIPVGIEIIIYA